MNQDGFDRILSEEEILPSSGFVASVMDAVRREATVPPPIPFPWKRALPGLAVAGLTLGLVLILSLEQLVRTVTSPSIPARFPSVLAPILEATMLAGAGWIILALLLTLVSIVLSVRLTEVRA